MSPKTPSTVFTAEAKPALVPKLRFPEFREGKAWEPATLGEKSSILKGKGISKADLDPNGSQSCIRYGELYTRYGETIMKVVSRTSSQPYPRIRYDSGGLENSVSGDIFGIREAVCLLLEGGEEAFKARENKYSLVQL